MGDLKPGIYKATVRGIPGVTVAITAATEPFTPEIVGGHHFHDGRDLTDIRPLVLLDPESYVVARFLALHVGGNGAQCIPSRPLADAIREQMKPPRIPEPEWGEKVIAHISNSPERRPFVHAYDGTLIGTVWTDAKGFTASWSDLIDPVLICEGVSR